MGLDAARDRRIVRATACRSRARAAAPRTTGPSRVKGGSRRTTRPSIRRRTRRVTRAVRAKPHERIPLSRLRRDVAQTESRGAHARAARTAPQRIGRRACAPPRWDRAGPVARVLADGVLDDAVAARRHRRDQWAAVHAELAPPDQRTGQPVRARSRVGRPTCGAKCCARWPRRGRRARHAPIASLAGRYDCSAIARLAWTRTRRQGRLAPRSGPQRRAPRAFWADVPYLDPAIGDHKIIWELNRHQHWLQLGRALWLTGDARYARRHDRPARAAGWPPTRRSSASTGRACWRSACARSPGPGALHFLLEPDGSAIRIRIPARSRSRGSWHMLLALDRQLTHVEQNLSFYFSPNTHLTGEALGALRRRRRAARARGQRALEGHRPPDSARRDRSRRSAPTAAMSSARRTTSATRSTSTCWRCSPPSAIGDDEAAAVFRDAATRLAEFTRTMADDRGRLPLIGDDDGGMLWPIAGRACHDVRDSLALAAAAPRSA